MLSAQQESALLKGGQDVSMLQTPSYTSIVTHGICTAATHGKSVRFIQPAKKYFAASNEILLPTVLFADVPCMLYEYRHQIICILHPAVTISALIAGGSTV